MASFFITLFTKCSHAVPEQGQKYIFKIFCWNTFTSGWACDLAWLCRGRGHLSWSSDTDIISLAPRGIECAMLDPSQPSPSVEEESAAQRSQATSLKSKREFSYSEPHTKPASSLTSEEKRVLFLQEPKTGWSLIFKLQCCENVQCKMQ
jgi:hypothetical protein